MRRLFMCMSVCGYLYIDFLVCRYEQIFYDIVHPPPPPPDACQGLGSALGAELKASGWPLTKVIML